MHEFNPMLGFRGVRLAIRYPEIAEMQARAIFEGAVEAGRKMGKPVAAEIMVPLVFGRPELDLVKAIIIAMAAKPNRIFCLIPVRMGKRDMRVLPSTGRLIMESRVLKRD